MRDPGIWAVGLGGGWCFCCGGGGGGGVVVMGPFDLSAVCCEVSGITCAGRSFFEIWCEWKGKRLAREFMSHPRVTVTLGRGGKRVFFFFLLLFCIFALAQGMVPD